MKYINLYQCKTNCTLNLYYIDIIKSLLGCHMDLKEGLILEPPFRFLTSPLYNKPPAIRGVTAEKEGKPHKNYSSSLHIAFEKQHFRWGL